MFCCVGEPVRESDGRASIGPGNRTCYFGRTARSTILIHGLDNSSTAESVWWNGLPSQVGSAIQAISDH